MKGSYFDDPFPYRRVAAVVVKSAVDDLQADWPVGKGKECHRVAKAREWRQNRVSAAQWLSSRAAAPFLDAFGLDHHVCLERVRWAEVVLDILREHQEGVFPLTPRVVRHLENGLRIIDREEEWAA